MLHSESDPDESFFRNTFDHAAVGIAHVSPEGEFLKINRSFCEITGYCAGEMIGNTFQSITHPDDLQKDMDQVQQLLEGKMNTYSLEKRYLHKQGHTVWVSLTVTIIRNESEEPEYFISIVKDITKQKKAENERDRFFDLSGDLITISGFDGYFKHLNPAWEELMGYKISELKERPFSSFIHPDDLAKTSAEVKKLSQGIKSIQFENRYITKEGAVRHFSWKATPQVENELIYAIARDITDRKDAEDQILTYQRRLKELGTEMTLTEEKQRKVMATELHDHVGQLLAASRLQIASLNDGMEKQEILSKMQDISSGLLQAIHATRSAIFNLSPPQLNEIGIYAATADWMEEQIESKYGILTRITGDERVFPLDENIRLLVFRCIRELFMNVVKHAKASRIKVKFREKQEQLEITVKDNGKGFNYHPDLVRLRNTGFGLFSILERMQDLGGSIEIDSQPGKGTTVILIIPFKTKEI